MSEYIVDGAVPNHTVRVEDEREVYWHMTYLPVREEIVRCRDCKHYTDDEMEYYHYCGSWCEQVTPDGFCAWAKKLED